MGQGGRIKLAVFGSLLFSVCRPKECQTSMYIPFFVFKIGGRKKNWGWKKGFLKNSHLKFYSFLNSPSKKFCFSKSFQEKWFFVKFEFSMIWALISCTYCMCLKKELDFQKFSYLIWANFHYESMQFRLGCTEKLDKLECWSLILQTTGDPNFHLRPCIQVLSENSPMEHQKLGRLDSTPPRLLDRPKSLAHLGLKKKKRIINLLLLIFE